MAKEFLSENKIHYVAKDVNTDPEARNEMTKHKITGVPAFLIGDDIVVGLDKGKILSLVDHRVMECPSCHKKVRVPTDKSGAVIKCPNCKNELNMK